MADVVGKSLRGKVVLIDFWTYTCINSLRPLPYVKSWATKYKDAGLVVIGVHTPEFSFEKERVNVENAARNLKVTYPVAFDSNYSIWQACRRGDFINCRNQKIAGISYDGGYQEYMLAPSVYIDSRATKAAEELQKLGGAHVILATAPNSKATSSLIDGLGPNGKLMVIGAAFEPIEVTPGTAHFWESNDSRLGLGNSNRF